MTWWFETIGIIWLIIACICGLLIRRVPDDPDDEPDD